ncbi:hypothetical protein BB734_04175 [Mycobacterium avium subsp. hominissuis]|nr:hypothetical protein CKJ63_17580 [Mycobacterium avium]PBA45019.1 hypothetical protein CKJ62_17490 [Mycobacterium avium]PBA80060.1 hypothetical protein CKJ72_18605 [Mycobacterium avium]PBD13189.1 hypothetical protein BI295_11220 [Mycobacterium avium subsp. hominissuis]PBJ56515.1 hypothetical protein BB734_04175 [Mycobacterium avium subsp. hominissuis]
MICDTPGRVSEFVRHRPYDQGISKLLFRTSCISTSSEPLGVVFRAPADPRTTEPCGRGGTPEIGGELSKTGLRHPTAAGRESGGLPDR